ncbi:biopolymer transporter Tol [Frondihabitans peucedani]|uniref:PD40 domain-containing protein n=1 Tax=Frondihabitans peucedani TaxID=598626 RepID=A0ABP8DZU8_9MICO
MPRTLLPGQSSRVLIVDPASGESRCVFESDSVLVEAPNWTADGVSLVLNADGLLWRLPVDGHDLAEIPMPGVPEINNDHVLTPDGLAVVVSAKDGHLYEVPLDERTPRRITRDHPVGRGYKNYLHGVSPDGSTLSVIVGHRPRPSDPESAWQTDVALVDLATGEASFVTSDASADDGAEFTPDGRWLWFNTERFTSEPGHAQLARVRVDGSDLSRVVESVSVDWFPHPAPDGRSVAYLSYEAGTLGHPENRDVVLRILPLDEAGDPEPHGVRDLLRLFGGQGTLNVNGWAPDSTRFACVEYPVAD